MRTIFIFVTAFLWISFSEVLAGDDRVMNVYQATLMESNQVTPEISTAEMQKVLIDGRTMVFDTRSHKEYAIGHIPGAINAVPEKMPADRIFNRAAEEIERHTQDNRAIPIVLYCNGPICGKSRKVAEMLVKKGYSNVRRYQLGIPIWRILQVVTESEIEGIRYVLENDRTAVLIDARDTEAYRAGTIPGAINLPLNRVTTSEKGGEITKAKKDGRLPVEDTNTRIIVFGHEGVQARALVEALAKEASFHNVSYFDGNYEILREVLQ